MGFFSEFIHAFGSVLIGCSIVSLPFLYYLKRRQDALDRASAPPLPQPLPLPPFTPEDVGVPVVLPDDTVVFGKYDQKPNQLQMPPV